MEAKMRDLALQAAGVLAIVVALVHGAIAELHVFAKSRIEPRRTQTLLRMVWQASTVDWIGVGILLIAAPTLGSEAARGWIVAVAVVVYGYGAIGNAVASRGRHIGWCLMACVIALALAGL
jgi:phosphoglycerate dehydrogenase-like enzyme